MDETISMLVDMGLLAGGEGGVRVTVSSGRSDSDERGNNVLRIAFTSGELERGNEALPRHDLEDEESLPHVQ